MMASKKAQIPRCTASLITDGFEKNSTNALHGTPHHCGVRDVHLILRGLRRLVFKLFSKPSGLWLVLSSFQSHLGHNRGTFNLLWAFFCKVWSQMRSDLLNIKQPGVCFIFKSENRFILVEREF